MQATESRVDEWLMRWLFGPVLHGLAGVSGKTNVFWSRFAFVVGAMLVFGWGVVDNAGLRGWTLRSSVAWVLIAACVACWGVLAWRFRTSDGPESAEEADDGMPEEPEGRVRGGRWASARNTGLCGVCGLVAWACGGWPFLIGLLALAPLPVAWKCLEWVDDWVEEMDESMPMVVGVAVRLFSTLRMLHAWLVVLCVAGICSGGSWSPMLGVGLVVLMAGGFWATDLRGPGKPLWKRVRDGVARCLAPLVPAPVGSGG